MECIPRFTHRIFQTPYSLRCCVAPYRQIIETHRTRNSITRPELFRPSASASLIPRRARSSSTTARAGWFLGLGQKSPALPEIVKAGDPVLHEPAQDVRAEEIGSERINKIIDDMVSVMRKAPGVGLAAPQIGVPLRVSSKYSLL